jgi:hypothetical protein
MIKIIEKVIKEQLAEYLTKVDFPLYYLKFSTATSGSGLNDKVIFLVFKNQACLPFLCLKTVRNYEAKQAILRNFHNLQKLNVLTVGSPHKYLFARAVFLYDDGENIFSLETACLGRRIELDKQKLKTVLAEYVAFQEYLAKQNGNSLRSMQELARETITEPGLNELGQHKLLEYFAKLPQTDIRLPRITQHGDLTIDNILLSEDGLHIVDYDDVGNTDVPGFDLFSIFRRFNSADFPKLCDEYFPAYFQKIGGKFDINNYRALLFLYNFIEYRQKKAHNFEEISVERVISGFEHLYPKI